MKKYTLFLSLIAMLLFLPSCQRREVPSFVSTLNFEVAKSKIRSWVKENQEEGSAEVYAMKLKFERSGNDKHVFVLREYYGKLDEVQTIITIKKASDGKSAIIINSMHNYYGVISDKKVPKPALQARRIEEIKAALAK